MVTRDDVDRVVAAVARVDPLLVEASTEVDDALLSWALCMSPRDRLRACTRATRALFRFRRAPPQRRLVVPILLALLAKRAR